MAAAEGGEGKYQGSQATADEVSQWLAAPIKRLVSGRCLARQPVQGCPPAPFLSLSLAGHTTSDRDMHLSRWEGSGNRGGGWEAICNVGAGGGWILSCGCLVAVAARSVPAIRHHTH